MESPIKSGGIFTRQATGLVRQLSFTDMFVFNASFVNVGLAVLYMALYVPGFHPGGSMVVATIVAAIIAIPTSLVYGMLSAAYPRSGGEYVFVSRVMGPMWGMVAGWNMMIWGIFYIGVPCALFARYGVAPLLRFAGISYDVPALNGLAEQVGTPTGTFITGLIALVIILLLYVRGTRVWARVQNILFYVGAVAILISIVTLLFASPDTVAQRLSHYMNHVGGSDGYAALLADVTENAESNNAPFSWLMTFLVLSWPCYNLFWSNATTYFGGEVRQQVRAQVFSLPLAVLFSGMFMVILLALAESRFGFGLLGSIARLDPEVLGFTFTPSFNELCAIISATPLLGIVILIGFLYWCVAWAPVAIGAVTRVWLAWSLDYMWPKKFSEVNPRFHTPVFALVFCGVMGMVCLALFAYIPTFGLLVGAFGVFITFMLASVAGLLMPFRRPQQFESSGIAWRIGRLPVISLMGALSILFLAVVEVSILFDPVSGISLSPTYEDGGPFFMLLLNLLVFFCGFIYYAIRKWLLKRRGIDIGLAFNEIPPE